MIVLSLNFSAPWTILCPTAAISSIERIISNTINLSNNTRTASTCVKRSTSSEIISPLYLIKYLEPSIPIPDNSPSAKTDSSLISNKINWIELIPVLIDKIFILIPHS